MKAAVLGLLGVGAVGAALVASKAHADNSGSAGPQRRLSTGKSGHKWSVALEASSSSANSFSVFDATTGQFALAYQQFTSGAKQGQRQLLNKGADATLAALAVKDFITG